jgi:hypothetical protein
LSALERRVASLVESGSVKAPEAEDVAAFRRPEVATVRCDDGSCSLVYTTGLPGFGRVLEDQTKAFARIFRATDVTRMTMRVVRGARVVPGRAAKRQEETIPGTALAETTCDRSDDARLKAVDWSTPDATRLLAQVCDVRELPQGPVHGPDGGGPGDPRGARNPPESR